MIDGDATPCSTRFTGPRLSKVTSTECSPALVAIVVCSTTGPAAVCTVLPSTRCSRSGTDVAGTWAMP